MRASINFLAGAGLRLAIAFFACGPVHAQTVADALTERMAAHDAARIVQQKIDALRGAGPSQAQKINDQALANALATARAQLEQAESRQAELNARLDAQRQTQAGLIPLLEHMLALMEQSVRADLPIHTSRRLHAIERARGALGDAGLNATQRFEKVVNLYQGELRLNYTTERYAAVLQTDTGERAVQLLRVGRIALYALAADRSYCAVYQHQTRQWARLADGQCQQLDALGDNLEQALFDGLPLSVAGAP